MHLVIGGRIEGNKGREARREGESTRLGFRI
jgi:hypothetical protein